MNCGDAGGLQHLYLDGELGSEERDGFSGHLRDCPSCRGVYACEERLRLAIRRDAARYPAPIGLRAGLHRKLGARQRRSYRNLRFPSVGWNPIAIAAALALTVATSSTLTASYIESSSAENRVVEDVVSSHIRSLMANHLTDIASPDERMVRPWFTGKVETAPPAVDDAIAGFPLVGGRLDYVDQRSCAVLVYRHDQHVINVLVWANRDDEPMPTESYARQGYNLVRFSANKLTFWAVSDLDRDALDEFVSRFEVTTGAAGTEL